MRMFTIFLVSTFFLYGCGGGGGDTPRVLISSIEFTDANLATCVSDTGFTYADEVTSLDCNSRVISDLTGIDSLTDLTYLVLGDHFIGWDDTPLVDISPLNTLTKLTYLDLFQKQIVDVSPLSSLINLTELDLGRNQIVDISPLNSLTSLTSLNLSENNGILCEDLDALEALLVDCDIARDEEGACNTGSGHGGR